MEENRFSEEWCGGRVSVPQYLFDDDGAPFRPDAVVWASAKGIVGAVFGAPADDGLIVDALRSSMGQPEIGKPRVPQALRVADERLASLIRDAFPTLRVRVAKTPELDATLPELRRRAEAMGTPLPSSYLTCGVRPETVAGFMRAAASFVDSMIFVHVANVRIEAPALGLPEGHAFYLQRIGDTRSARLGVLITSGPEDLIPDLTIAIMFCDGDDVPPAMRREVLSHGWRVAGSSAYPMVNVVDRDVVGRAWTEPEARLARGCLEALSRLHKEYRDRESILSHDERHAAWSLRVCVRDLAGRPLVRMHVPKRPPSEPPFRLPPPSARARSEESNAALIRAFARGSKKRRREISSVLRNLYFWRDYYLNDSDDPAPDIWTPEMVETWMFEHLLDQPCVPEDFLPRVPRIVAKFFDWLPSQRAQKDASLIATRIRVVARAFCRRVRDPRYFSRARRVSRALGAGHGFHEAIRIADGHQPVGGIHLVRPALRKTTNPADEGTT